MKSPSTFLTNPTTPVGRAEGQAINDPGGSTGSGVDQEIYNDPAYASIAPIQSYKDGGISDSDETTINSDMRDALEEMNHMKVTDSATPANSIDEWDVGTTYSTLGELVMWKGFQFVAYNVTANLAKDPLLSPDFWYKIPKPDVLMDDYFSAKSNSGGMNPIADRAGGTYRQNIAFGRYRLGGNGDDFYNFFRVALDGTQVTGNATLEAIFDVGGGNEYFNLDLIAPDVAGTRTLIDMGERIATPQSSSGENDTIGEVLDDRFQGHRHEKNTDGIDERSILNIGGSFAGAGAFDITVYGDTGDPTTDGTNGTPRTGLTTRPKELTEGASYIVVMLPV